MPLVTNFLSYQVSGDAGGIGMAKFACTNVGGTQLASSEANAWAAALRLLWDGIKASMPSSITWSAPSLTEALETDTAGLVGQTPVTVIPAIVVGTGTNSYPAGTGARLYWHTATVINRRFVRGATYIIPLTQTAYGASGFLTSAVISTISTAAGAYLTAMGTASLTPVVYHRPTPTAPNTGQAAAITASSVTNTVSSLRSRRR